MEIKALKVFDKNEDCKKLCPILFDIVSKLFELKNDQIHILMGPIDPLKFGVNGAIKE